MSSQIQNDELLVKNETSDTEVPSEDEFTEMMSPNESTDTVITGSDYPMLKSKIVSGEYKISNKRGKSRVWNIFGQMQNNLGEEIENIVICRICHNIYKYNSHSTSNLVRHKCYIASISSSKEKISKIPVDADTKQHIANIVTEWVIYNCRSYEIIEDSGLHKLVEFLLSVGEKFGRNLQLESILPHSTTISQNVNKVYNIHFEKVKAEVALIKNIGFGLTVHVYNDSYLNKIYIALTIHYINEDNFTSRVLGLKSIEKCLNGNVAFKVSKMLNEYDLKLDDNSIIVSSPHSSMIAEFHKYNHITCINHLLFNTLERAMQEVKDVAELSKLCNKLANHFEITYPDANLNSTLKSLQTCYWNKTYNLYVSIERNWSEIVQLLKRKNELISIVNLKQITAIIEILKPFQETFKRFQEDKSATIHLVYAYINRLQKKCSPAKNDVIIVKQLKEKLSTFLQYIVLNNLTMYHKIGLFLFPPTNKLIQFNQDEKISIKDECKRLMKSYHQEVAESKDENEMVMPDISSDNSELFSDLMDNWQSSNLVDRISNEILMYESKTVRFYDDFNVLQWWHIHRHEFPLLYKVSCKILAIPASSAASVKLISLARNLISEKDIDIVSTDDSMNEIIFLHSNIDKNELQKNLLE